MLFTPVQCVESLLSTEVSLPEEVRLPGLLLVLQPPSDAGFFLQI